MKLIKKIFFIFTIFLFQTNQNIMCMESSGEDDSITPGIIFALSCYDQNSNKAISDQIKKEQQTDKLFFMNLHLLENKTNIKEIQELVLQGTSVIFDIKSLDLDNDNNFDKEYTLYTISDSEKQYILTNTITTKIEKYPNVDQLIQAIKEKVKQAKEHSIFF